MNEGLNMPEPSIVSPSIPNPSRFRGFRVEGCNIGAFRITNTILGFPYDIYSLTYTKTLL